MTKHLTLSAILAQVALLFVPLLVSAQITTEPAFPTADDNIRIIYDATQGTSGLVGATKVYMHSGTIIDSPTGVSWTNVVGNWGQDDGIGLMTKVAGETDKWEITISPRDYFNVPSGPIYRIGMVFRNADGSKEGKTDSNTDIFLDLSQGGFNFSLNEPSFKNVFVETNDQITISANASDNATFNLSVGGVIVDTQMGITEYSYVHTVTESSGAVEVILSATDGIESIEQSFAYVLRSSTEMAPRPAGTRKGINYFSDDDTRVVLCLEAPTNSGGYVIGDFTEWKINDTFKMKKDGDFLWAEVTGLTPGVEYAFRYLVDESIYIADPYADKILDTDDRFITNEIYPNLMPFPEDALVPQWYFNRLAVLQTGQEPYQWVNQNFTRPEKENLVIYELLIRDFFGPGQESFANLIDSLSYFKSLGVNAIELMPITEFGGNNSWGYNNSFMFATDKAYGPKNKLKEFIDAAHGEGIAVIFDMVMNHQDIPSPLILLDFNYDTFKPTATNPWFNESAPHTILDFFYDVNHASSYTQDYLDSLNQYWIEEYHFDGFRFDFTKGFTQKFSSGWASLDQYDPQRVSILKRMANKIWSYDPGAYVILEHFADNTEETELANSGMMLWGNVQHPFKQNALGFSDQSDIENAYYVNRGWNNPNLVAYAESHDEQRLMYENLNFGNQSGFYDARNKETALQRMKALGAIFFSIPGPKMIWQFQEWGYDIDINYNGRTTDKPVPWNNEEGLDYGSDEYRLSLKNNFSELIKLKTTHSVFNTSDVLISGGTSLVKQVILRNENYTENPASSEEMNVVVAANFDIISKNVEVSFPHTGTWYNHFSSVDEVEVTSLPHTIEMKAGDFRLYTDYKLQKPDFVTSIANQTGKELFVYPNPVQDFLYWTDIPNVIEVKVISLSGKTLIREDYNGTKKLSLEVSGLPQGMYILVVETEAMSYATKFLKK